MNFSVIDIGHGNCSILEGAEVIIIDAGPGSALLEYLEQENIEKVDLVLLSHSDADHISGLIALLACGKYAVTKVILNPDSSKNSKLWDDLLYTLDDRKKNGETEFEIGISSGWHYSIENICIEAVAPTGYIVGKGPGSQDRQGNKITSNSCSAAFRLSHNEKPFALCAGDIDDIGLSAVLEEGRDLSAPVLVFPHHGGKPGGGNVENFVNNLCSAVNPNTVVFSTGREKYNNPFPAIVTAIRTGWPNARIACTQLSKECSKREVRDNLDHLVPKFSAGKECGRCCAGTIWIPLEQQSIDVLPSRDTHRSFIDKKVDAPMCCCPLEITGSS